MNINNAMGTVDLASLNQSILGARSTIDNSLARSARDIAIERMAEQCIVGNAQIAKGNNSTVSHAYIADAAAKMKAATALGQSTCQALRFAKIGFAGSRADFIAAAESLGINKATAGTQWSRK